MAVDAAAAEKIFGLADPDMESILRELQAIEAGITADVYQVLTPERSVASRISYGGAAPAEVRRQVSLWKERLSNGEA